MHFIKFVIAVSFEQGWEGVIDFLVTQGGYLMHIEVVNDVYIEISF